MATTDWTQEAGMTGTVDTDNIQDLIDQAETAESNASTSATNAATSATAAAASATSAASSATTATTQATNSSNSASAAAAAQSAAETAEINAETAETNASGYATNAANSATSAATSATTATSQAAAASGSATDAATSETNAATSETNAATSATSAATSATNAASSATAASASETAAAASETAAAASETAAATSETNAATSATTATTQATNAATSATNAATSETNAATSASSASTSATSASTSATNAANSATAAAASQTAAAASAASAASAYDSFDDRYLGTKSSDPTLDNDGNALVTGALYFNSTANEMRVYDGGNWIAASSAGGASLYYYNYTATSSQTTFSGADDNANTLSYTVDNLIVTLNGVTLENGTDYTATDGTSVVLTVAASTSDELNIVAFKSFTTADMVSATNGGTFQGAVTFSGNALFGDNDKAIFGAGSDLQIYHTGTYSAVQENGTGNLYLGASNLSIMNGDFSKSYIYGSDGDKVALYFNDAEKLATTSTGIDVTGTVTADKLTVVNSGLTRVDIGSTDGSGARINLDGSANGDFLGGDYSFIQNNGSKLQFVGGTPNAPIELQTHDGSGNKLRQTVASNGDISFYEDTGTTAKFFWDASGESLGIGTSSPSYPLTVRSNVSDYTKIMDWGTYGGGSWGTMSINVTSAPYETTMSSAAWVFKTANTERMRIDSSGRVCINRTSPITNSMLTIIPLTNDRIITTQSNSTSLQYHHVFNNSSGSMVGNINVGAASTSYNTSSDYRLKTDVQPMTGATERLKALKPVNFEWISSGERVDGFIAHEAQEVVPEAVTGTKDAMRTEEYEVTPAVLDDDGNVVTEAVMGEREVPDYQGIDQSKLVPLLVATVQEQQAVIESLTSRIEALENN